MINLTETDLKIFQVIFNMAWQSIFWSVVIYAFLKVLSRLLNAVTLFDAVKCGAIEAFLASTIYLAFKYWFPV